jgi:hypothetical protein
LIYYIHVSNWRFSFPCNLLKWRLFLLKSQIPWDVEVIAYDGFNPSFNSYIKYKCCSISIGDWSHASPQVPWRH